MTFVVFLIRIQIFIFKEKQKFFQNFSFINLIYFWLKTKKRITMYYSLLKHSFRIIN